MTPDGIRGGQGRSGEDTRSDGRLLLGILLLVGIVSVAAFILNAMRPAGGE